MKYKKCQCGAVGNWFIGESCFKCHQKSGRENIVSKDIRERGTEKAKREYKEFLDLLHR